MISILEELKNRNQAVGQMQIAVSILQIYNCRSAEVLRAQWKNFFPNQYLILEGVKRSANIIVRDRMILNEINNLPRIHPIYIFNQINKYKLYSYCKKNFSHLFVRFKGKKNYKVTHGFRYAAVEYINNELYVRDVLFHRSVKSGRFYKSTKGVSNDKQQKSKNSV
jgi:integrase